MVVVLVVVFACSASLWGQSKTLHYDGFHCAVYGSEATKVLDNDESNLAYDFNVTELGAGSYVAVFHAEPYRKSPGCWGDSVAARYASSPDGYFGSRTGDCNNCPGDTVISRTSNGSHMMGSSECSGVGGLSGGGNPILIQRQGSPAWALFYLSVSDYDEPSRSHNGWWRHYVGVAHPSDVGNMSGTDWAVLANDGSSDYWQWFSGGPPVWRDFEPWGVRLHSSGALVQSADPVFNSADTQGLIGNMSYDGGLSAIYYFYLDSLSGQPITRRQQMLNLSEVSWWHDAVTIRNDWVNVAYHVGRRRWAVFSNCYDPSKPGWDVCLQFTPSGNVDEIGSLPPSEPGAHGLGLAHFFNDPVTGGIMEQYGFLKNAYGQVPGDDFRVYVPERTAAGLYGMDVYSVRVACECDTALCGAACCGLGQACVGGGCCQPSCDGRACGDDGCGGSCGSCEGGFVCNAEGQCITDACVPDCGTRSCGPDPVCGLLCGECGANESCDDAGVCGCAAATCLGTCCTAGQVCFAQSCCSPSCQGSSCGDDGCGGLCGVCGDGETCNAERICIGTDCVPDCSETVCGPDPVCGFSCGSCEDTSVGGDGPDPVDGGSWGGSDAGDGLEDSPATVEGTCGCRVGATGVGSPLLAVLFFVLLVARRVGAFLAGLCRTSSS